MVDWATPKNVPQDITKEGKKMFIRGFKLETTGDAFLPWKAVKDLKLQYSQSGNKQSDRH